MVISRDPKIRGRHIAVQPHSDVLDAHVRAVQAIPLKGGPHRGRVPFNPMGGSSFLCLSYGGRPRCLR